MYSTSTSYGITIKKLYAEIGDTRPRESQEIDE